MSIPRYNKRFCGEVMRCEVGTVVVLLSRLLLWMLGMMLASPCLVH